MNLNKLFLILLSIMCSMSTFARTTSIYSDSFNDSGTYDNYAIIDANNDGKTWTLEVDPFSGAGTATAKFSYNNDADDWLFLPSLPLEAGITYTLSFDMYGGLNHCTEKAEVYIGSSASIESMNQVILEPFTFNSTASNFSPTSITFEVAEDGNYNIAFHAISEKDMFAVILDNVEITFEEQDNHEPVIVELPYIQTFDDPTSFEDLTIINANEDYKEWEYQDGKACLWYNANEAADDWLILPGMNMQAGMGYTIQFDAWAHIGNQYPERIEVKYGNSPSVEGMLFMIMEPTVLTNKENEPIHFEYNILPSENGIYYIGFHGISDPDQSRLFLDNISVSEKALSVPAAPFDFTVTPDPLGSNTTTIAFQAPDKDLADNTLTSIEKIEILREDELIHTINNPTPGEQLSYVDNGASRGLTTYKAVAYTASGRGAEAFATVFVGINTPAPVPSVTVTESESKPGQVTISWEEPTVDVDGNPINKDLIYYEIVERNGIYTQTVIKTGIKGTSYTYQAVPTGEEQRFMQWGVYSYTENGTKHDTRTETTPVGKPYSAPLTESFANGSASSILDNKYEGIDTGWAIYTDEDQLGATAQDGDNGFSGFVAEQAGEFAQLSLGKVSLEGVENPALTFYLYNPTGSMGAIEDLFEIDIYSDYEWTPIVEMTLEELNKQNKWNRIVVPLQDYS